MFPSWINSALPNLVKVSLINCSCLELPPLGQLPNLKDLYVRGMAAVQIIGREFYGTGVVRGFPSLQQLEIYDMPNLVEWKSFDMEETDGFTGIQEPFPCLEQLIVEGCSMLTVLPFIPNLKNLALCNIHEMLLHSLYRLPSLPSLVISNFQGLDCLPDAARRPNSIKKLTIHECDSLDILFEDVHSFSSLRHLSILHCDKLNSLPPSLRLFDFLQKLDIVDSPRLGTTPDIMHQFSCLMELTIESCPILKLLPESIRVLSCLQRLVIKRCPVLEWQLEMETHNGRFNISHVPYIEIGTGESYSD